MLIVYTSSPLSYSRINDTFATTRLIQISPPLSSVHHLESHSLRTLFPVDLFLQLACGRRLLVQLIAVPYDNALCSDVISPVVDGALLTIIVLLWGQFISKNASSFWKWRSLLYQAAVLAGRACCKVSFAWRMTGIGVHTRDWNCFLSLHSTKKRTLKPCGLMLSRFVREFQQVIAFCDQ